MVEQVDKSELPSSRIKPSHEGENNKLVGRQDQYLRTNVIDVFGKETERICDYPLCHHKFSEHGRRICKCQCTTTSSHR
jgi:hypothetical protein